MEHAEAIDKGAVERYALGEMSEDERDRYEEHFFDCPECATEVVSATLFLENARAVVAEDDAPAPAEEENLQRVAAPSHEVVPEPPSRRERWTAMFWPVPLGAAAALVVLLGGPAAYLAFLRVPELERARAEAESLQAASWHFLSVSRSEPPLVKVAATDRVVGLTLSKSEAAFPYYLCEVRDAGGRVVLSNVVAAPPAGGELQLLLPTGKLQPGAHVVAVAGLEIASSRAPASDFTLYPFTFERQ